MNSRQLTARRINRFSVITFFWLPVFCFSLIIVRNTLPYFSFSKDFSFIRERAVLFAQPFYNACFYVHIMAGAICILTALVQFSSWILKKRAAIHVWSGRIYVLVVLLFAAPTGLYMSFFAKGTTAERFLFLFMAVNWFACTLQGLTTILNRKVLAHKTWMIRSYAMALTAVTFRVYYLVLYLCDVEMTRNYEVSLWISVIGNMLVAELLIDCSARNYLKTFTN